MTIRRWFFVVKDDGNTKKVYLYDAAHSDLSDASKIQKSKEDLGPVTKVDTAEGKKEKIAGKYGAVHGLVVSIKLSDCHKSKLCTTTCKHETIHALFLSNRLSVLWGN